MEIIDWNNCHSREYLSGYDKGYTDAKAETADTMCKLKQVKASYETRLNADLVAMLTEIQLEIDEINIPKGVKTVDGSFAVCEVLEKVDSVIQSKIDKLKEQNNENNT